MQVIAYTHSGDAASVAYGFACLFVIGFIWAAFGGAGTAMPAFLSRARLTETLLPVGIVILAWIGQDVYFDVVETGLRNQVAQGLITKAQAAQQMAWTDWYDTDWIAVVVAAAAVLALAVLRRRICWGTSLALYMCAGWWIAFTLLTVRFGLRMTPPRGDNWAGALGMLAGVILFLYRRREWEILWTTARRRLLRRAGLFRLGAHQARARSIPAFNNSSSAAK